MSASKAMGYLERIGGLAVSLRQMSMQADQDETGAMLVGMTALAEKIGYLSDKAAQELGASSVVCGSYDEWIGLVDDPSESD